MPADTPVLVEDVIIAKLLSMSAVSSLVGTRVRPGTLAQADALPAIGTFTEKYKGDKVVIWVHPDGKSSLVKDGKPHELPQTLRAKLT